MTGISERRSLFSPDRHTDRHTDPTSLVSRPLLFRSAGCITSPARGRKGLETLARFSCALEEFAQSQWGARCHVTDRTLVRNI